MIALFENDPNFKPCPTHKWLAVPEDESFNPKPVERRCVRCGLWGTPK